MAIGNTESASNHSQSVGELNYNFPMVLMVSLYFGIGFITSLNDILVPHFKDLFHLSNFRSLLVQFCFFGAYFIMSMPSGRIVGRVGYKSGIVIALCAMGLGLLLFIPGSMMISYPVFLFALFVVGSGLALLQVAVNPYVAALGEPATAASRLNLCGGFNSIATTIAPRVGAALIFISAGATSLQLANSVRLPYMVLASLSFVLATITRLVRLPELIERGSEAKDGAVPPAGSVWQFRNLRFGAAAIFFYVGAEVAIGSLMIEFLGQSRMGAMTHEAAAHFVSLYWGGCMVGRFIGFGVLRRVPPQRLLTAATLMAFLAIGVVVLGNGPTIRLALVSCGFFNSVMWPCIFSLGVKGLGRFTSRGSGILVTMVVGGAIIPEIQGALADTFGYQHSFVIVWICYAYLVFFGLIGYSPTRSISPR